MKKFRKTSEDLLICEECNKTYNNHRSLGKHISQKHYLKIYYDKWLKEEIDGLCKICGNNTGFVNLVKGYKDTCSRECKNRYCYQLCKRGMQEKYGIDHNFKRKEIREKIHNHNKENKLYPFYNKITQEKIKIRNIEKYGVENQFQRKEIKEKCKQTLLEKTGYDHNSKNPKIKEKIKKTKKEKYGDENYMNIEKFKKTCLKNFGVEWPMQNKKIFEKGQINGFKAKLYKDTNIYYRGSYELDFLEKYYTLIPDVINADTIKYLFQNKHHHYFPDFYIPSLNLIIEIKSKWTIKQQGIEKINAKEKATITNGFKYLVIVEKNYNEFNKLIHY